MTNPSFCYLCGLPLKGPSVSIPGAEEYRFCCLGCKQVFSILTEATGSADPAAFRESKLYRTCREMGIIPGDDFEAPETAARSWNGETLTLTLQIEEMWCPACAWLISTSLGSVSGVAKAECQFTTDRLVCEYDPVDITPQGIKSVVERLGYRATDPEDRDDGGEFRRGLLKFALCGFLTMNIMMMSFGIYSGFLSEEASDGAGTLSWPIAVMSAAVLAYGGRTIFMRALRGLPFGVFGMETLVSVGALGAFLLSIHNLLRGSSHIYFDTSAMLLTLALLGKTLERRAALEVKRELGRFFSLKPKKVRLCTDRYPAGRHVSADLLGEGDLFSVEPGEGVAADGLVVDGSGGVDESSLTGEPLTVGKRKGMRVKSGSRVVHGWLKIRAEAVGRDSALGQMIEIVEKALGEKGPFEGKAEAATRWLVPLFLVLSLGTGAVCLIIGKGLEEAFIRGLTVLVISCPCAVGIAVPIARVAGISVAGSKGILLRHLSAFEKTRGLNAIVFDKTGTLTRGVWVLNRILPIGDFTEAQALSMAAGIEAHSDHPIAEAIRDCARRRGVQASEVLGVKAMEGGLSGGINGQVLKLGSGRFLKEEFRSNSDGRTSTLPADNGDASRVYMSLGGRPVAVLEFGDDLKDHSLETVSTLNKKEFFTVLLSGDGDRTTKFIGGRTGVHESHGDMSPTQKAQFVKGLQTRGFRVAMVGDGINDAPALGQSDLGIAIHSGGHLGKEVAEVTLMRGEPSQVTDFLDLAAHVNRKVFQNLSFSFLYNMVAVPIAMSGLLTPIVAVSAMLLSSLSVTGNTLLLLRKRDKR